MEAAKKVVKEYIACPHCGEATNAEYYQDNTAGPWERRHDKCGGSFMYQYVNGSAMVGPISGEPSSAPILSLLVLPPQKDPVYFVLGNTGYRHGKPEIDLDNDYYYNENSCPTNWLDDIRAVIIEDDADPHGLLQHVRSVLEKDATVLINQVRANSGYGPVDVDGSSDGHTDYSGYASVFPEIIPKIDSSLIIDEVKGPAVKLIIDGSLKLG